MKLWNVEVETRTSETVMVYAESYTAAEKLALTGGGDAANASEVVRSSQIPHEWRGVAPLGEAVDGKTCGEWVEDLDAAQYMAEHQLPLPLEASR